MVRAGAAVVFLIAQQVVWPAPAGIVVQGALIGGLTALVSLGIALVYRANRIINFAQGDLGALPASLAVLLIVSTGLNYFVALAAGLAAAVVLGTVIEFVIIRRFANSPRLILTVATIGVAQLLAAGGLLLPQWFRVRVPPQNYPPPFHAAVTFGGVTFRGNDLLAMAVIPVAIGALTWWLRRSTIGVAVRASADDPERAALLGIDVHRLHTIVWIVATVLSTLGLFLRAGVVGLPVGTVLGPGILVRALAAVVIGRAEDAGLITASAMALGVLEQAVVHHTGKASYVDPVLFIVILVALLADRRSTIGRHRADPAGWLAVRETRPVPRRLRNTREVRIARVAVPLSVAAILIALPAFMSESRINLVAAGVIYAVIGLSLVVLTGWSGQVSLGQIAFVGVGAAVGGWITASGGADLTVAIVVAGLVGAAMAILIGLPALRLGGLELAVTTLAFALAASSYGLNPAFVHWLPTGRIPRRAVLGLVGVGSETRFYYLTLVALALAIAAVTGLRRSGAARTMIASRENPAAAEGYGVNTTAAKLTAFAASGFLAAAAGALFVHHQQSLGTSAYAPAESLSVLTMVVVGGLGSVPGVLLGAAFVRGADWLLPFRYRILATGVGLLAVLLVLPQGLSSILWPVRERWLRWVERRHGAPPAAVSDREPEPGPPAPAGETTGADGGGLDVRGLNVHFGGATILDGVDFAARPGEVVALVGTNGAGKSTLLRAVSRLVPSTGEIRVAGTDAPRRAHRVAAAGVDHLPGGRGVFPSLTVAENLELARWQAQRHGTLDDAARRRIFELFPALAERLGDRAGDLSGGEQQLVALAMVLTSAGPLLLLDELSLGLSPAAIAKVLPLVTARKDAGATVVVVEQSVPIALSVADTAYVLEKGRVRHHGPAADLAAHPDLLRSVFLASAHPHPGPGVADEDRATTGRPVLTVEGLTYHFGGLTALDNVNLRVAPGEIVGLIGPNGAGKTTLFDVISGHLPLPTGRVTLEGADVTGQPPHARAASGLGRSWQDSRLFPAMTVSETLAVALSLRIAVHDPVAAALHLRDVRLTEAWVDRRVTDLLDLLGLSGFADRRIEELSTGTRRVVDLACVLAQQPKVVLLDEPSSGLAQREAEELGPMLRRIRDETGASLVIIEHDLEVLRGVAERVVALDFGRVIAEGTPSEVLEAPEVIAAYLGPSS